MPLRDRRTLPATGPKAPNEKAGLNCLEGGDAPGYRECLSRERANIGARTAEPTPVAGPTRVCILKSARTTLLLR